MTTDWNKAFTIVSVTRTDLLKWGFPEDKVSHFTDEDMNRITQQMAGLYLSDERGFWSDLEYIVKGMLQEGKQSSDLSQKFPIIGLIRTDLQEAGIPEEVIAGLSDEDIVAIARKMADFYCDQGFWEQIKPAVDFISERKQAHD